MKEEYMINKAYNEVDNLVVESVTNFAHSNPEWVGTMTDLGNELVKVVGRKNKNQLPGSASVLRRVIDRNIGRIRNRKVSVRFTRTVDRTRTRLVILKSK